MQQYFHQLKALELFSSISDTELKAILRQAKIKQFAANETILIQHHESYYFYLLLQGKVKLFSLNQDSHEAIFNICSPDSPLLDPSAAYQKGASTHAKALTDSIVLAWPLSDLQNCLKQCTQLSVNMAQQLSIHYQESLARCAQLTHQTALQRVGWFLLNLFVKDKWRHTTLPLPFEKFLIANYLGMKPESFSRVLLQLKKSGVHVFNQNVSMDNKFALCHCCSYDLTQKCSIAKKECF